MDAFVTLATNDSYAIGALVWAYALKRLKTSKHICIMVTDAVGNELRSLLAEVADSVQPVQPILVPSSARSAASAALHLLGRPDLQGESLGLAKLRVWQLTHFSKVAYMDADTLPLVNIDDLLDREELSAAPDPGWPDWFNSGVMVLRPSEATFDLLMRTATNSPTSLVDGSDQGLLNVCLADRWKSADISRRLPFGYNCLSYAFYTYLPALRHFRGSVRIVHFAGGNQKPWQSSRASGSLASDAGCEEPAEVSSYRAEFLGEWWRVYDTCVLPRLIATGHHHSPPHLVGWPPTHNYPPSKPLLSDVNFKYGPLFVPAVPNNDSNHQNQQQQQFVWQHQLPTPMPYQPPSDVAAFYANSSEVDNRPIDYYYCAQPRDFTTLDTHYAEPPMGLVVAETGDPGMDAMYSGQEFCASISNTDTVADDKKDFIDNKQQNQQESVETVKVEHNADSFSKRDEDKTPMLNSQEPSPDPTGYSSQMAKYKPVISPAKAKRLAIFRAICSHPIEASSFASRRYRHRQKSSPILRSNSGSSDQLRHTTREKLRRKSSADSKDGKIDADEDAASSASTSSRSETDASNSIVSRLTQSLTLAGQKLVPKDNQELHSLRRAQLEGPPPPPVSTPMESEFVSAKSDSLSTQLPSRRALGQRLASIATKESARVVDRKKAKASPPSAGSSDRNHRLAWERGEADYRGRDGFSSVLDRLRQFVDDLD